MKVVHIHDCFKGDDQAYIYIWLSKSHKVVYVGMTNGFTGTIGRANGHFIRKGQLRSRFEDLRGYSINKVDDLVLLSFALPKKKIYTSVEKSYREAIEYLVQKKLLIERGKLAPTFDVISWVRSSPRTSNSEIVNIANQISQLFIDNYATL